MLACQSGRAAVHARLDTAWAADERHVEVQVAWSCAQLVRSAYHQDSHAAGLAIDEKILASFTTCPIPEVARLGRTLKQWRTEFLGYFDTDGASTAAPKPSTASSNSTDAYRLTGPRVGGTPREHGSQVEGSAG